MLEGVDCSVAVALQRSIMEGACSWRGRASIKSYAGVVNSQAIRENLDLLPVFVPTHYEAEMRRRARQTLRALDRVWKLGGSGQSASQRAEAAQLATQLTRNTASRAGRRGAPVEACRTCRVFANPLSTQLPRGYGTTLRAAAATGMDAVAAAPAVSWSGNGMPAIEVEPEPLCDNCSVRFVLRVRHDRNQAATSYVTSASFVWQPPPWYAAYRDARIEVRRRRREREAKNGMGGTGGGGRQRIPMGGGGTEGLAEETSSPLPVAASRRAASLAAASRRAASLAAAAAAAAAVDEDEDEDEIPRVIAPALITQFTTGHHLEAHLVACRGSKFSHKRVRFMANTTIGATAFYNVRVRDPTAAEGGGDGDSEDDGGESGETEGGGGGGGGGETEGAVREFVPLTDREKIKVAQGCCRRVFRLLPTTTTTTTTTTNSGISTEAEAATTAEAEVAAADSLQKPTAVASSFAALLSPVPPPPPPQSVSDATTADDSEKREALVKRVNSDPKAWLAAAPGNGLELEVHRPDHSDGCDECVQCVSALGKPRALSVARDRQRHRLRFATAGEPPPRVFLEGVEFLHGRLARLRAGFESYRDDLIRLRDAQRARLSVPVPPSARLSVPVPPSA